MSIKEALPQVKELWVTKLKEKGLDHAEDLAQELISEALVPSVKLVIESSDNKIDDIALPWLDQLEDALKDLADKIDGKEEPEA